MWSVEEMRIILCGRSSNKRKKANSLLATQLIFRPGQACPHITLVSTYQSLVRSAIRDRVDEGLGIVSKK